MFVATKETKTIYEWIETCPGEFTSTDIFNGVWPILTNDLNINRQTAIQQELVRSDYRKQVRKCISNIITRFNKLNKLESYKSKIDKKIHYTYVPNPDKPIEQKENKMAKQTEAQNEKPPANDLISEHEMGRAIFDYIVHLRNEKSKSDLEIKQLKNEAKQLKAEHSKRIKEKEDIISRLNDKIVELNRQVTRPNSRTFSIGEMARVSSLKK